MSLWDTFAKEWPALQDVWMSVVGLVFLALAAGWGFGRFMYGQRIELLKEQSTTLQERLRLRDDELASARANLEAAKAKPDEAAKIIDDLRLRLESIQPYLISKEGEQRMLATLRQHPSKVRICVVLGSTDADPLYRQVVACFRAAAWTLIDSGQIWKLTNAPDSGVAILTWDGVPAEDLATIKLALDVAGLDAKVLLNDPNAVALDHPQIVFSSRDPNYQPAARWG
jgi:hypothetical protein